MDVEGNGRVLIRNNFLERVRESTKNVSRHLGFNQGPSEYERGSLNT